jgi:DNA end-binding protein Ku
VPSTIWSGTIGFGLVSVPVKVVSATKSQDVRFNQLEEGTGSRIRYRRVSEASGDEVPNERIVKGYQVSPGQYVVVEEEEMQSLAPKASRTIEIEDFVDLHQIDPIFFENPYYLVPDRAAAKPYQLLVESMTQLEKVAVGRIVMRGKEHLVAIRPLDGVLCVEMMRYADEVIPPKEIEGLPEGDVEPTQKELDMARQLIEALSGDFEPEKYHDQYREQLLELIEKKAAPSPSWRSRPRSSTSWPRSRPASPGPGRAENRLPRGRRGRPPPRSPPRRLPSRRRRKPPGRASRPEAGPASGPALRYDARRRTGSRPWLSASRPQVVQAHHGQSGSSRNSAQTSNRTAGAGASGSLDACAWFAPCMHQSTGV